MEALHLIRSEDQSRNVKAEGRNCDAKRCLANGAVRTWVTLVVQNMGNTFWL